MTPEEIKEINNKLNILLALSSYGFNCVCNTGLTPKANCHLHIECRCDDLGVHRCLIHKFDYLNEKD